VDNFDLLLTNSVYPLDVLMANKSLIKIKKHMKKVKVLAFGIAKDILGEREIRFELPEESTVAAFRAQLMAKYPELAKLQSLAVAVNGAYAQNEAHISAEDEVVLIPPVSGG